MVASYQYYEFKRRAAMKRLLQKDVKDLQELCKVVLEDNFINYHKLIQKRFDETGLHLDDEELKEESTRVSLDQPNEARKSLVTPLAVVKDEGMDPTTTTNGYKRIYAMLFTITGLYIAIIIANVK